MTTSPLFPDYVPNLLVVHQAIEFAKSAHGDQKRWDGSDYWLHCVRVASRCMHHGYVDTATVVGALLHDVCEDTPYTLALVSDKFGPDVAGLVDALSQRKGESRADYFTRCMAGDERVLAIKVSDRCDNHGGLSTVPALVEYANHVQTYFDEFNAYFLPVLDRVRPSLRAELEGHVTRASTYFQSTPQAPLLRFPDLTQRAS